MAKHKQTNLAEQLQQAITESGQSLYAVAKGSGIDYSALLRFTSGERGLTLDSAGKVAVYLGLALRPVKGG